MKKIAIIVAGGSGSRMGSAIPKQFLMLNDKPVLWHTVHVFLQAFDDLEIRLVLPEAALAKGFEIVDTFEQKKRITIVKGGNTRFASVKNGLQTITEPCIVFVHDGVRCLVSTDLIKSCYAGALQNGNAVPAVVSTDSIRLVDEAGNRQLDRERVHIVQTPQTFLYGILLQAFAQPYCEEFTDEATVVESIGEKIYLVTGDYTNIKITRPIDLLLASHILAQRKSI